MFEFFVRFNFVISFGFEFIFLLILDNYFVMLCVIFENDGLWFFCLVGVCVFWEELVFYLFYGVYVFILWWVRFIIEIVLLGGRFWSYENLCLYGFCFIVEFFLIFKSLFYFRVCDEGIWGGIICLCLCVVKLGEGFWKNVRYGCCWYERGFLGCDMNFLMYEEFCDFFICLISRCVSVYLI